MQFQMPRFECFGRNLCGLRILMVSYIPFSPNEEQRLKKSVLSYFRLERLKAVRRKVL